MNEQDFDIFIKYHVDEPEVYKESAKSLLKELNNGAFGFDPMTIMAVISLIKTLIDLYIQCKKNDWHLFSDVKQMKSGNILSFFKKRRLKGLINKTMKTEKEKEELFGAFLKFGLEEKAKVSKMFELQGVK